MFSSTNLFINGFRWISRLHCQQGGGIALNTLVWVIETTLRYL